VTQLIYYSDGAIDVLGQVSGAAVVVRDACGRILDTACRRLAGMTNNEAEYEALILALELALARGDHAHAVTFLVDSRNIVGQVAGAFAVRDPRLAARHGRVMRLLAQMPTATLAFVPRDRNRVADALAQEALHGR
jgi:ribonuclease HI